jgi:hypothetical protein
MWLESLLLGTVILGIILFLIFFERQEPDPNCKLCGGEGFIERPGGLTGHFDAPPIEEVCSCWHTAKERKHSVKTKTHWKCIRTKWCQEADGFKGTVHEGVNVCEGGCAWYQAFKVKDSNGGEKANKRKI